MDAAEILVIILASFLAFFLLLSIVLAVLLIKIAKQIKHVTTSAERTVTNIEGVASALGKSAGPAAVASLLKLAFQQSKKFAGKNKK